MRISVIAALAALAATPALADTTAGTVYTFDAKTNVLVMSDQSVWHLGDDTIRPEAMKTGDKVIIAFTSAGDDGVVSIEMVSSQPESGA